MKIPKAVNDWRLLAVMFAAIIIAGGVNIGLKYRPLPGVEISLSPESDIRGNIYVGGQVENPGIYPLLGGDSIDDLLRVAGGLRQGAAPDEIQLLFSGFEADTPQKIDINRAEAWLLEALPDIGEGRAQAIIDYRVKHGLFRDIHELRDVPGLGDTVFEKIKDLVAVSD
jgi:competence protein ComEA